MYNVGFHLSKILARLEAFRKYHWNYFFEFESNLCLHFGLLQQFLNAVIDISKINAFRLTKWSLLPTDITVLMYEMNFFVVV